MRYAIGLLLLLGACVDDPQLRVTLTLPDGYDARVSTIALDVVVPPPLSATEAAFDCTAVALGDVPVATYDGARRSATTAVRGEVVSLPALDADAHFLLVARASDDHGQVVAAGCVEQDGITGAQTAALELVRAAVISMPTPNAIGTPLALMTAVEVHDVDGAPLAGAFVRAVEHLPGGTVTTKSVSANASGIAVITPDEPTLPGPIALDVSAAWSSPATLRAVGFALPKAIALQALDDTAGSDLLNPDAIYQVGPIGPAGEVGVAALETPTATARKVLTAYLPQGSATPVIAETSTTVDNVNALGLITAGDGRATIVGLGPAAWHEFGTDGSVATTVVGVGLVKRLVAFDAGGGCAHSEVGDRLLSVNGSDVVQIWGPDRAQDVDPITTALADQKLLASGCVATTDGDVVRVIAAAPNSNDGTRDDVSIYTPDPVSAALPARRTRWFVQPEGIGFAPALAADAAQMMGVTLGADGVTLDLAHLRSLEEDDLTIETAQVIDQPSVVSSSAAGDLDGDGLLDVVSVVVTPSQTLGLESRLVVALGQPDGAAPIVGVSPPFALRNAKVAVADFDRDGRDDIMIGGSDGFEILSSARIDDVATP